MRFKTWLATILCLLLTLTACSALADDLPMTGSGVANLLLLGADAYADDVTGRSDTVIVLQINERTGTLRMASFLRDLYVEIPGHGSNRLNAAYAWGDADLVADTLRQNFGVVVNAYAVVDFEKLVRIIDALGGIDLELTDAEVKAANGLIASYNLLTGRSEADGLLTSAGMVRLTGKQALGYARIRKLDSDFGRTGRQRKVLEAAFRKAMSMDYWSLAGVALGNLDAVSTNLGLGDILDLIPKVLACRGAVFETCSIPDTGLYRDETISGMMVLVPDLPACRRMLADFFRVD